MPGVEYERAPLAAKFNNKKEWVHAWELEARPGFISQSAMNDCMYLSLTGPGLYSLLRHETGGLFYISSQRHKYDPLLSNKISPIFPQGRERARTNM